MAKKKEFRSDSFPSYESLSTFSNPHLDRLNKERSQPTFVSNPVVQKLPETKKEASAPKGSASSSTAGRGKGKGSSTASRSGGSGPPKGSGGTPKAGADGAALREIMSRPIPKGDGKPAAPTGLASIFPNAAKSQAAIRESEKPKKPTTLAERGHGYLTKRDAPKPAPKEEPKPVDWSKARGNSGMLMKQKEADDTRFKGMRKAKGGAVKGYAKGGSIDGCAKRGRTKGKVR